MRTKMCLKNLKIADLKHPQSKATVIHALVIHFFAHFGSVMCGEFLVWNSAITGLKDSSAYP